MHFFKLKLRRPSQIFKGSSILLSTAFLFLTFGLKSQVIGTWNARVGSANRLSGKIFSMNCFVSESGKEEWSKEEKMEMLLNLAASQAWLNQQARFYGVSLSFENQTFGFDSDLPVQDIGNRGLFTNDDQSFRPKLDWLKEVVPKMGIGPISTEGLNAWVQENKVCDNYQILVFVKGAGRSFALPYNCTNEFVELAIIFQKLKKSEIAQTMSHEILHLYSAWDLYDSPSQPKENRLKANMLLPNSIMNVFNGSPNVDKLTAWIVGWNVQPEIWFDLFLPVGY
jgi:hypothetical protein